MLRAPMRIGRMVGFGLAAAFAGYVFYSLFGVEPVEVVGSHVVRDGALVAVAGEVRNTGAQECAVDLEIHYYDQNGRPLGTDALPIAHLRPGERREFLGPHHELGGFTDFSIYLSRGRNPYGN